MPEMPVLSHVADGVARITLNRPYRLNAASREMMIALRTALETAAAIGEHPAFLALLFNAPHMGPRRFKSAIAGADRDLEDDLATEAKAQDEAGRHPDHAEGVLAFLEKRQPKFA